MNTICFALYGSDPKYSVGLLENVKLAKTIYPGWKLEIFVTRGHPIVTSIPRSETVLVHEMDAPNAARGMFWRFLPIADLSNEHVIIRDADSRLNWRERGAVDAWIASGKLGHVMRDHPHHAGWNMMGGMWGILGGAVPNVAELISQYGKYQHLDDMNFLHSHVYPVIKDSCMSHGFDGEPFPPSQPEENNYVGQIWNADNRKDTTRGTRTWK